MSRTRRNDAQNAQKPAGSPCPGEGEVKRRKRPPGYHPGMQALDAEQEYALVKEAVRRHDTHGRRTIFELLGRPSDIPGIDAIPPGRLQGELERIRRRLGEKGIHITTLRPDIEPAALYRYITGPFLRNEVAVQEARIWQCFAYDNREEELVRRMEATAADQCIRVLLDKRNLLHMFPAGRPVGLNQHSALDERGFRQTMHAFRNRHHGIACHKVEAAGGTVKGNICRIWGRHVTDLCDSDQCTVAKGAWLVEFRRSPEVDEWQVTHVHIGGVGF